MPTARQQPHNLRHGHFTHLSQPEPKHGGKRVGNWPGKTVSVDQGDWRTARGSRLRVAGLPGSYSLLPNSPDEALVRDVLTALARERPDAVVFGLHDLPRRRRPAPAFGRPDTRTPQGFSGLSQRFGGRGWLGRDSRQRVHPMTRRKVPERENEVLLRAGVPALGPPPCASAPLQAKEAAHLSLNQWLINHHMLRYQG
ncbi:FeoB small GTPase domain-containing protein [Streptomyces vinaceus]|uniref:FeoB small GTPase domain-containing protein n=1 Tax=Streptomyces vinaceus TaxID=1960 RepID=UPI003675C4DA